MTNDDNLLETKAELKVPRLRQEEQPHKERKAKPLQSFVWNRSASDVESKKAHAMGYACYVRPPWNDEEFVRNIAIEIKGLDYVLTEEKAHLQKAEKKPRLKEET